MEGKQFGNYTLLERISHGGMAEVYRAKSFGEAGFEREVALKVLLPQIASDEEFVTMLIDEAKIAGQLNHTNIAQIFDLGVTDGRYYIVQEYVRGQDLRAILKHKAKTRTHFEIATACFVAVKVCEGLHYAHNKRDNLGSPLKVVHRDISPHNVLISSEGEVKIIDFGIAKAEGRSTQTLAGLVKGKFAYMSPEQIRGLPVDHRSDVFATGIILYEMLTTRSLFRRGTEFETLKMARSAKANPPSFLRAEVPPELDAIVLKALARHVHDRYQSADELRNALWSFARDHDAYRRGGILSEISDDRAATVESQDLSIQIELASEVSAIGDYEIESSIPIAESFKDDEDEDEDEDEDGEFENPTIVDSGNPFHDETVPVTSTEPSADGDAAWAADIDGPLPASNISSTKIMRSSRSLTNETDVETGEYGHNDGDFDEPTNLPPTINLMRSASPGSPGEIGQAEGADKRFQRAGSAPLPRPRSHNTAVETPPSATLDAAEVARLATLPPSVALPIPAVSGTPPPSRPESGPSGSHSGPMPLPDSGAGLRPVDSQLPLNPQFGPRAATEGAEPLSFPTGPGATPLLPTVVGDAPSSGARLYWVLAALLFLLLSSAASIALLLG